MPTIMFVDKFGQEKKRYMEFIPRIGDTIPLFHAPYPKVAQVVWFPEETYEGMEKIDVFIVVE